MEKLVADLTKLSFIVEQLHHKQNIGPRSLSLLLLLSLCERATLEEDLSEAIRVVRYVVLQIVEAGVVVTSNIP